VGEGFSYHTSGSSNLSVKKLRVQTVLQIIWGFFSGLILDRMFFLEKTVFKKGWGIFQEG
jgi:hypothetical protein